MSGVSNFLFHLFHSSKKAIPTLQQQVINYAEDYATDFSNPERGLYSTSSLTNRVAAEPWKSSPMTLQMKEFTLPTSSKALPPSFLDMVNTSLNLFHTSDIKVILLFAYTYSSEGADAPIDIVLTHIKQLSPILKSHSNVIAVTHAGFAGAWGEWGYHNSTNDLVLGPNKSGKWRKEIKDALLEYFPGMIAFRRPNFIGPANLANDYHFGDWFSKLPPTSIRFDGSLQSRVSLFNDCFLDNETNGSWYDNYDGTTADQDRLIASAVTRITPAGGETCNNGGLNKYNTGTAAIKEMEYNHWDYLNASYWTGIYESWPESVRLEISRRLGYRYVLESATLPVTASPGETIEIELKINNVGFGKLYNPRPLKIVLVGKETHEIPVIDNCCRMMPLGGQKATLTLRVVIPTNAYGNYDVYLSLPDKNIGRIGCKIRFANINMWDPTTGNNDLKAKIKIT